MDSAIGVRIREARIAKKMNQAELAAQANLSLSHVSDIENGKTNMSLATFVKLIEALQVSADSILRPDVPSVKTVFQNELGEMLKDCSPSEYASILRIVKEVRAQVKAQLKMEHSD